MNFSVTQVLAVGALPVRKADRLIPLVTPLYPNEEAMGLYAGVQAGATLLRVQGQGANESTQPCVLRGYLGEEPAPVFESGRFLPLAGSDTWNVPVALVVTPQGFLHVRGPVRWQLVAADSGENVAAATTVLDLCFVPGMPAGAEQGVPYEVLLETQRALAAADSDSRAVIAGDGYLTRTSYQGPPADVAAITNWLFTRNPPAYDTLDGHSHFVTGRFDNITLNYTAYLEAKNQPGSICNCYDMAAIVQYHVQFSTGLVVRFAFMNPFGYLRLTTLIGRGQCNNPFYDDIKNDEHPVCNQMAPNRSAFGNHAFGYLPAYNVVVDACAGPHVGNEDQATYVTNAQDKDCAFPKHNGNVTNIDFYDGVKKVTFILPPLNQFLSQGEAHDNGFAEAVGFALAALPTDAAAQVASLPSLPTCPQLGPAWQVLADDVAPGYPLVRHRVVLNCPEGSLSCNTWVASDGCRSAQRLYLDLGANTSLSTTAFSRGPVALGDSAGQVLGRSAQRYLWLWHNFVFDMRADGHSATAVVLAVAEWLQAMLQATAVPLTTQHLPQLVGASISPVAVRVGEEVVLQAQCPPEYTLAVGGEHPGLYIAEEQADLFRYRAARPSENHLLLYAVENQTLLATQQDFVVKVS